MLPRSTICESCYKKKIYILVYASTGNPISLSSCYQMGIYICALSIDGALDDAFDKTCVLLGWCRPYSSARPTHTCL